ncbi:hypothetical protein B9Z55_015210 [Caenorhabditis nigoni]|uniref:Uncharacterized protein n=1 Tax=Caenorhabditis nigoni TaxID=1611254 RepID=A0A2G5U9Z7_9PELO|nr:hypothetical protein B9Z55_015210 [Caenorhabditis nigoni]
MKEYEEESKLYAEFWEMAKNLSGVTFQEKRRATYSARSAKSLARYEMINPDCELDYDIACLAHIVLQKEALSVFSTEFAMKVQSTRESQL